MSTRLLFDIVTQDTQFDNEYSLVLKITAISTHLGTVYSLTIRVSRIRITFSQYII